MLRNRRRRGFSLTELSVSMTIIALIASSALSVAITSDYHAKTSQTNSKMDRIEEALAGYLALNKRLPCPADGTLTVASMNFGLEGTPNSTGCTDSNFDTGNIYSGVIPARTLQLPDDFMFDGWGRRFTYAIDYRFANNNITNTDCDGTTSTVCFIDTTTGGITVKDGSGNNRTAAAIYLLLSHGENGHGAFTKNGSATRINAYNTASGNPYTFAGELENSHLDSSGSDTAYNATFVLKEYMKNEGGEYFDDIVRFRTKIQTVKAAGAIFYESICRSAVNITDNPGSNACTGADSESTCESFASEIADRCLN